MFAFFTQLVRLIVSPFRSAARFLALLFALMVTIPTATVQAQEILRVDIENGTTTDDGSDWGEDAIQYLQDALARAEVLLGPPFNAGSVEIWVAQGTYRPDQRASICGTQDEDCEPCGDCNQSVSFELRNDVALYGGFPPDAADSSYGPNGATFDHRDWEAFPTILSGDLDGDDNVIIYDSETGELILEFENDNENNGQARSRNQATVGVTPLTAAERIDQTAIISGFTVRSTHRPAFIADGARLHVLNCVFSSSAPAAVHLRGEAEVVFYGCAFDATGDTISAGDAATFHCVDD